MRALSIALVALSATVAAQSGKPPPVEPAELPADWGRRDLEGKWHAYRLATGDAGGDARVKEAWAKALGAAEELELLEWIAIHEGWRGAGPELQRLDAPQLFRAAAWNLGSTDSHNLDNAEKAMRQRAPAARGWFEAHPVAQRGKGAMIYKELAMQVEPEDAARYLPPHDPMQVLVPWLDAPAELADFGDRLTAEPRARYVHQVLRALDGVTVFGRPDPLIVRKVLRLCRHGDAAVHRAAFGTLSELPGELVPHGELAAMARDAELPATLRHLATTALSYASHPEAFFEVHAIALQRGHPGRVAAVVRLGEIGDDTSLAVLQAFGDEADADILAKKQQAARRIGEHKRGLAFIQHDRLMTLLRRVAWLRATRDARAPAHADAAKTLLLSQDTKGGLARALDSALKAAKVDAPFTPELAELVDAELRKFVNEVR